MTKSFSSLLMVAAAMAATFPLLATAGTRADYSAAKEKASATYKLDRAKCDALTDNKKDVCIAEAKAAEKRADAVAENNYKGTMKSNRDARIAFATSYYMVDKAKCAAKTGNEKDVCLTEAKAVQSKAIAAAKTDKAVGELREDERKDSREADYKVAVAKCDTLSGAARASCIKTAKADFKM